MVDEHEQELDAEIRESDRQQAAHAQTVIQSVTPIRAFKVVKPDREVVVFAHRYETDGHGALGFADYTVTVVSGQTQVALRMHHTFAAGNWLEVEEIPLSPAGVTHAH